MIYNGTIYPDGSPQDLLTVLETARMAGKKGRYQLTFNSEVRRGWLARGSVEGLCLYRRRNGPTAEPLDVLAIDLVEVIHDSRLKTLWKRPVVFESGFPTDGISVVCEPCLEEDEPFSVHTRLDPGTKFTCGRCGGHFIQPVHDVKNNEIDG